MLNPTTAIDNLVMLRLKDTDLSSLSDEELIAKYHQTAKQMRKAYTEWRKKQPVRVV